MFLKFKIHHNKQGVTLLELILVLALSVIVVSAASTSLVSGSRSYYTTRNLSQAINLSNDILEALDNEIKSAYFAKMARGSSIVTNSSDASAFSWATYDSVYWERPNYDSVDNPTTGASSINIQYQYLIFVDTTNNTETGGKIICQSRAAVTHDCHFQDIGTCYQISSKYYENMKIANLKFEKVLNKSYGTKFTGNLTVNSVTINRNVENILKISFEVRQKTTNKIIYKAEGYSMVLENIMTNISTEFNSKYINYNTLRIGTQDNGTVTGSYANYNYFLFTKEPCE